MKKIILAAVAAILISISFQSCKQKKEIEIVLPEIEKDNIQGEYAVIQEPYAAFYDEPYKDSGIAAHARRGDVLHVEGRKIDDDRQLWIKFDRGWIQDSGVIIYSNKLKAENAASNLE